MKNSVIIKVTNDKYEFILDIYDTTKEMQEKLNVSKYYIRRLIGYNPKKKKNKYIRVWIDKGENYESK